MVDQSEAEESKQIISTVIDELTAGKTASMIADSAEVPVDDVYDVTDQLNILLRKIEENFDYSREPDLSDY